MERTIKGRCVKDGKRGKGVFEREWRGKVRQERIEKGKVNYHGAREEMEVMAVVVG